jgi:hypothetical protein
MEGESKSAILVSMDVVQQDFSEEHLSQLRYAKSLLERPSLAARLTDVVGAPIEKGFKFLPEKWSETLNATVKVSLEKALSFSVRSLSKAGPQKPKDRFHRFAAMAAGAGGGAFGLGGLVVELPVSTVIMLRSIADIARSEGEDVSDVEAQLACLEVFALGGRSKSDDAAETGYFAIRTALANTVSDAARYLAQRGAAKKGTPALVRLISAISARFGVVVSEKAAAMAVPAIGAAGGAIVNSIFISHFQDMARGHFIVRRLEREYGQTLVRQTYESLPL